MPGLPLTSVADLLDILPDAVLVVDAVGRIGYCNPAVRSLLGYSQNDLTGQPLSLLLPPAVRERHELFVADFREHGQATMMGSRPVLSALHRSGRVVPVSISICNLGLDNGERVSVAVVHDVSALNTHLDRASEQAQTDALTGLGNRLRLSRRMQGMLSTERPFAVLVLDLQQTKPLDERLGPDAGDEALRTAARRMRSQVRDEDVVVRLGAGAFAILLDGLEDGRRLAQLAGSIQRSVSSPMRIDRSRGALAIDVGGALRPRHGNTERELLEAADRAMVRARQAGGGYQLAGSGGP